MCKIEKVIFLCKIDDKFASTHVDTLTTQYAKVYFSFSFHSSKFQTTKEQNVPKQKIPHIFTRLKSPTAHTLTHGHPLVHTA